MALKVNSDIALTGSLTVSGSYGLAAADIPSLAADKITSGTFAAARIPSLAASKITSGTFADARIASAANWNTAYGWGNHASAGYSTFDGAYDSLTGRPTIPTNNNQLTNGAGYVTSSGNTVIGTDSDITTSGATVIDDIYMTDGVITSHTTRTLTPGNIGAAYYDHFRSLGTTAFTAGGGSNDTITTAQLISEMEGDGAFDSYTSAFKTSWSYAGNDNLTDAGDFTETAGTAWLTWTDNSSDSTRGNITALAIAPNTGGSAGRVFIYNDQGSSYSPGWREVWTNSSLNPFISASVSNDTITFTKADGTTSSVTTSDANTNYYLNGITKSGNTLTFSVNGTTNQTYTFGSLAFSSATYDNYGSWNLKTGGTQRTTVGSGGDLDIVGGTNVSVAYSAGGVVTISSTDTNTTYSVGDGGLTQKNFTTTLKNKLDGIATNADAYGGWNISDGTNSEKIQANNTLTVQGGGSASVSYDSGNNTLTIDATDTNTTYSVGDGGLTQKNFTTALKTKLDGIATGADVTPSWVPASNPGYSTAAGVEDNADVTDTANVVAALTAGTNITIAANGTISSTDTNTTYSTATSSTLGLVKIGYAENGKNYPVELSSGKMFVNVPWTDTNTDTDTITRVGVSGSEASGVITLAASGAASISQSGSTVTISATDTNTQLTTAQVRSKISGTGLISYNSSTGVISTTANNYSLPAGSSTVRGGFKIGYTENGKNYPVEVSSEQMYVNVPWTDTNTTYSNATTSTAGLMSTTDKSKLDGIAASANNYSLPAGSSTVRGGFKIGYTENGKNYPVEVSSEKMYVNVPWTDTNTTYSNATTSTAGLMSSTDKSKLNGIASGATVYSGWNLTDGAGTSSRIDSLEYVKFSGADITGSGSSSDPFVVVTPDNNTTYTADGNYGMTLSGTAFRLEDDRRRNSTSTDIYTGNTHDYTFYDASVGIRWYTAGAEEMRLEDDGDLHVDGDVVAFSATVSDARLKDDVETIENATEKIKQLRGVEYTWNKGGRGGQREIGVIAQEVEKVVPEIVHEKKLPFIGDETYKTVDYEKLVALLIESNKELAARVETLEAKLDGITK